MRFENTGILITGAGGGIGRAASLAFAEEGAAIAAADLRLEAAQATASAVEELGRTAVALQVDVTQPDSVRAMVERAVAGLGSLDVLINSAGVREIVPFLELPAEEWLKVIGTNLTGTFLCSQAVARHLIAQGKEGKENKGGKIINLSSVAGLMGVPNRAAYVASKHGVVGLTKEMGMELADKNIQVNAIAPGVVETAMTAGYFDKPDIVASLKKAHPAGRWAQPEEIARLMLFLASEDADFMTGATIPIDGGFVAGKAI